MGLTKWVKNQLVALAIATSNVSNNLTSQKGETLEKTQDVVAEKNHGSLLNALKNGQINQEVKDLRWRTYKVIQASQGVKLEVDHVKDDGTIIYKTVPIDYSAILRKVKLDTFDNYELQMVVNNDDITASRMGALTGELTSSDNKTYTDDEGDLITSIGNIDAVNFDISQKSEKLITINRDFVPRFYIEQYTKKVNIRKINDDEKLLEFYVSKYADEYRKNSQLFINQMKKAYTTKVFPNNIFDFKELEFVSYNTLGSPDFREYKYEILKLDKMIEFDGNYVIKYVAKPIIEGKDILSEYVEPELEKKYENKEVRKK